MQLPPAQAELRSWVLSVSSFTLLPACADLNQMLTSMRMLLSAVSAVAFGAEERPAQPIWQLARPGMSSCGMEKSASAIVHLNVGGQLFETSMAALTNVSSPSLRHAPTASCSAKPLLPIVGMHLLCWHARP